MSRHLLSLVLLVVVLGLVGAPSMALAAPPNERPYGSNYPSYYDSSFQRTYASPYWGGYYPSTHSYTSYDYNSGYISYYSTPAVPVAPVYPAAYTAPSSRYYWTPDGWARAW